MAEVDVKSDTSETKTTTVIVETPCGTINDVVTRTTGIKKTECDHRIGDSELTVDGATVSGKARVEHVLFNTAHPVITNNVDAHELHEFSFAPKSGCRITGASVTMSVLVSGRIAGTIKSVDSRIHVTARINVFGTNLAPLTLRVDPREDPSGKSTTTTTTSTTGVKVGGDKTTGGSVTVGGKVEGVGDVGGTVKDEAKLSGEGSTGSTTTTVTAQKEMTDNTGSISVPATTLRHTFVLDETGSVVATDSAAPTLATSIELDGSDSGWHWDSGASASLEIVCRVTRINGTISCRCGDQTSTYSFVQIAGEKAQLVGVIPSTPIGGGTGGTPPSEPVGVVPGGTAPVGSGDIAAPGSGSPTGALPPKLKTVRDLKLLADEFKTRADEKVDQQLFARAGALLRSARALATQPVETIPVSLERLSVADALLPLSAADKARLTELQEERARLKARAIKVDAAARRIEAGGTLDETERAELGSRARAILAEATGPVEPVAPPDPDDPDTGMAAGEEGETAGPYCIWKGEKYSAGAVVCAEDKTRLVCNVPAAPHNPYWQASGTCS